MDCPVEAQFVASKHGSPRQEQSRQKITTQKSSHRKIIGLKRPSGFEISNSILLGIQNRF